MELTGKRTLILGIGDFASLLAKEILARPQCGYQLVGIVNDTAPSTGTVESCPMLGCFADLHRIIVSSNIATIIVALTHNGDPLPDHQLLEVKVGRDVTVEDGDAVYERLTGQVRIEALEPRGVIFAKDLKPSRFWMALARALSCVVALVGLVLLLPLFAVIALLIRLDSPGPVLFVQQRVGLGGKPFNLLKFRTMRPSRHHKSEWAADNNDRITRIGRVLRKYRIDELPQLINVVKGEMNLVGPRPHPASNFSLFVLVSRNTPDCGSQIPYYSLRSLVRPGITGWAQVRYRYANNLKEEIEKLRFDLYYVKHYSLWLDLQILLETIRVVALGRKSSEDAPAPSAEFHQFQQNQRTLP